MLAAGTRLGPYEIVSPLGSGGMGEVYRAKDEKLKREVAVKVLPESLLKDADALARFEREAHSIAAFSHPNILSIHDSGTSDGIAYVVTELLEGETLRSRLDGAAIAWRRAVEFAIPIARGLAAAHEKGIAHRDLKPENVFLTSDGRVKILDFGLAKRLRTESAGSNAPTLAETEPGTVLGTVGYMSPEQVRGRELDHRTDIFSFGAILYEMLSGQRAFRGGSSVETMSSILKDDPPDLLESGRGISPALDRIVRHCLEKSPEARFQSAGDVAFDLEAVSEKTTGSAAVVGRRIPPGRRAALFAAAILALAAAILAGRFLLPREPRTRELRPVSFVRATDAPGVESTPTISPDGKSVVYVSDAGGRLGLFLLRIGGRNPAPLTVDSSDDDWQPAFSPDGERIAFRSERGGGGIFVMGSTGESVRRVTDFGYDPTWSPDGREVAVSDGFALFPTDRSGTNAAIWAVDMATGKKRPLLSVADGVQPSWSPHGRRVAFWGLRHGGQRDLWTVAADGSEAKKGGVEATNDAPLDWAPVWSPDGKFLYFSSTRGGTLNLWRVPIDESSGKVLGAPDPVTTPSAWSGRMSFSRDGTRLAYESLEWKSNLLKIAFDAKTESLSGAAMPILHSTETIRDHRFSPDGQWLVCMLTGTQEDIFVVRADGSQFRRLTDDAFRDRGPSWSPDGQTIAFYSDRSGGYELWTIHPDGSGLQQLTRFGGNANTPVWSPDGSQIAEAIINPGRSWCLIDVRSSQFPRPYRAMADLPPGQIFWPFSWSPDGRRLAGLTLHADGSLGPVATYSFDTGRYDFVKARFDTLFKSPIWLADSQRLLVRDRRGIRLIDSVTGRTKSLIMVGGYASALSVGISRDNRWITYTETGTEGDIWIAEMK